MIVQVGDIPRKQCRPARYISYGVYNVKCFPYQTEEWRKFVGYLTICHNGLMSRSSVGEVGGVLYSWQNIHDGRWRVVESDVQV